MDATKLTYIVLGQKLLRFFDSKALIDWAVDILQLGYDSESLQILAGLDNSDTEEREKYFCKAIRELNFDINTNEINLIEFYVDNLIDEVLSGNIPPKFALRRMSEVAIGTNYSSKYMRFYMLADEIDSIEYSGYAMFTNDLNKSNADEYILNEFRLFRNAQV